MNSISNRHYGNQRFKLSSKKQYDFQLADTAIESVNNELPLLIDLEYNATTGIFQNKEIWSGAISETKTFPSFSLTGLDNGRVPLNIDFETTLNDIPNHFSIDETNKSLELYKVTGHTQNLNYTVNYDIDNIVNLQGGFFQGFYKLYGYDYQTLPERHEEGWTISVELKPGAKNETNTLNDYSTGKGYDTKGFFFYTGTRAENKYWNTFEGVSGYTGINETTYTGVTNNQFIIPLNPPRVVVKKMKNQFLIFGRSGGKKVCTDNNTFTFGTHMAQDVDKNPHLKSNDNNEVELHYTGRTTFDTYDEISNFLKYGRSSGKPVCGTEEDRIDYVDENGVAYDYGTAFAQNDTNNDNMSTTLDVNEAIPGNALGFRVTDDGTIGYRRIIKKDKCKEYDVKFEQTDDYVILEEYTEKRLIPDRKWYNITLRWTPVGDLNCHSDIPRSGDLDLYVNGLYKHTFKDFEEIINQPLEDDKDKQLGVSYNISVGGGTQGLLENMTFGGPDPADLGLLIEKNFAGTFIGGIRNFRMFQAPLSWCEIKNNMNISQ